MMTTTRTHPFGHKAVNTCLTEYWQRWDDFVDADRDVATSAIVSDWAIMQELRPTVSEISVSDDENHESDDSAPLLPTNNVGHARTHILAQISGLCTRT